MCISISVYVLVLLFCTVAKECNERTKREGGGKAILINCALSKSLSGGNQSPLIKLIMMMMTRRNVVVLMMTTEDYDEEEEVQKSSNKYR